MVLPYRTVIPGQPAGLNPESRGYQSEIPGRAIGANAKRSPPARPGMTFSFYPSTVLPFLITVTSRDFTFASNEITLPSFQRSMVTVSPG